MLPQFYQTILTGQLSPKTFHFLQLVLGVLQQLRQVKLETLAHCLGMPIRAESAGRIGTVISAPPEQPSEEPPQQRLADRIGDLTPHR